MEASRDFRPLVILLIDLKLLALYREIFSGTKSDMRVEAHVFCCYI